MADSGFGVGALLSVELEGVFGVHHDFAAFLFDGWLEPGLFPFAGGLVGDVEEALDAVDAVDDAAGEAGAVGDGVLGGFGRGGREVDVGLDDLYEFFDREVEDEGVW